MPIQNRSLFIYFFNFENISCEGVSLMSSKKIFNKIVLQNRLIKSSTGSEKIRFEWENMQRNSLTIKTYFPVL